MLRIDRLVACRRVTITSPLASKLSWLMTAKSGSLLTTFLPKQHSPVAFSARRTRVSRQVDSAAGRRRVVQRDQAPAPDHRPHHRALEAALPATRNRRTGHLSSRPKTQSADSGPARPHLGGPAEKTRRRVYALELPQAGLCAGHQQRRRAARVAAGRLEAAPPGTLPWPATTPSSRARPPTSSASIYVRRSTPPCSASTRRPPFKPCIRLDPVLPLSPGRAERHGFKYHSHGTLSLYAALHTATGRVHGKTAARHTSREFVAFLQEVVSLCPPRQQIHIILDNLSAHKTQAVRDFLQQHPRVRFHFTPTYSSWLNQVEIWFAKIEREVIARGIFTSVSDLARKLRRYINAYSANARPIQWKYSDPTRRVRSNEITATGHSLLSLFPQGKGHLL